MAGRRRRISYPRWFLKVLWMRQLFASALVEKLGARRVAEGIGEFEQLVAERGASAASASDRTRELAGL